MGQRLTRQLLEQLQRHRQQPRRHRRSTIFSIQCRLPTPRIPSCRPRPIPPNATIHTNIAPFPFTLAPKKLEGFPKSSCSCAVISWALKLPSSYCHLGKNCLLSQICLELLWFEFSQYIDPKHFRSCTALQFQPLS